MSDSSIDREMAFVRTHLDALAEHFDCVQLFATRCETGELDGTVTIQMGAGNWYTRYGHVREWLIKQDERARMKEREPE